MTKYLLFAAALSFGAQAATPYKRTLNVKKNAYLQDGVFVGGKAGAGATLLGVRRMFSPKAKIERVIMDLGNKEAKSSKGAPGYFQVAMDKSNQRIVVDLAQLRYAKVNEQQVRALFRQSPFVKNVSLTFDPEDKTGTMVLELKRPARLEVFELTDPKKTGRVVMDLKPLEARRTR